MLSFEVNWYIFISLVQVKVDTLVCIDVPVHGEQNLSRISEVPAQDLWVLKAVMHNISWRIQNLQKIMVFLIGGCICRIEFGKVNLWGTEGQHIWAHWPCAHPCTCDSRWVRTAGVLVLRGVERAAEPAENRPHRSRGRPNESTTHRRTWTGTNWRQYRR